jgi:hypothetical protein
MVSRTYAWLATGGGAWSLASNWNDVTDGIDPSLTLPGPQDSVMIAGPGGSTVQTITGQGSVAAAVFSGNTVMAGSFSCGTLSMGAAGAGGLLDIGAGATLDAGTLTLASGSLLANGTGSDIAVSALVAGAGQTGGAAASCNLDATGGGQIQIGSLALNAGADTLYVDPGSSIEIGSIGGATIGALTVDAGATLSGQGDADAYAAIVNNGTIAAVGGTLLVGALNGTGLLSIGARAVLTLNGTTHAGQTVRFAGAAATLALATEFDQPQGTITGFAAGDAIDLRGSPISAASYASTGAGLGILSLFYGSQIADTLTLAGTYTGDVFLTAGDGAGGTLITVDPEQSGGGGPSGGTTTPDVYLWTASGGGAWNNAAHWADETTGASPAAVAPGANNLVTITAPQSGSFDIITGPANAATLTTTGDVALSGAYTIGTLTVGQGGTAQGTGQVNAVLELLPATTLAATDVVLADGEVSVAGSAVLAITGTLSLGGGVAGIGLPVTALSVTAGGTVTAASLSLGGGSGDSITTDPTGVVDIGGGNGAAGAVTIANGAALTGNGSVNPFGAITDNGTITASGGLLTVGSVTGTGQLAIGAGAGLVLESSCTLPVAFTGSAGSLALADELVALHGTISGFAAGDTIDILQDPITSLTLSRNAASTSVTLYYNNTEVNVLTFAGSFTGENFVLAPDGQQGTDLMVAAGNNGGGGTGQGTTDTLAWTIPGSGAWEHTSNWTDVTTGKAALAPPGAQNTVELIGAAGSFQTIGGPGVCATLACFGDTLLNGAFTAGTLAVGGTLAGTLTTAILDIGGSSSVTAATALATGGVLLVEGAASTLAVTGTLTLGAAPGAGGDGTLAVSGHGAVQLGGLVLAGLGASAVSVAPGSVLEIGDAGSAAAGLLTIDAGYILSGYGAANTGGTLADNGTILAQEGTLAVGACAGTGTLAIGTEATLQLTGSEACAIQFTGGGATLLLQGAAEDPVGIIAGFAAGDLITTGSSQISGAGYIPGAGNTGTLTLYDGAAVAGTLLLAGSFAGDNFIAVPDGEGSAIALQTAGGGGPPAGTTTPDEYAWTGLVGTLWAAAANWDDISAGQANAAVAPGSQDLVSIQGAIGTAFTTIAGPANAASLSIAGNVALAGAFNAGSLAITAGAALALGSGTTLADATASINGLLLVQAGGFSTAGTLALVGGKLQATGGAAVLAGAATLGGTNAVLSTDATGRIEIGATDNAVAGAVSIDQGAVLSGAGAVNPSGAVIDNGTLTASGGTLAVGTVTGTGALLIGVDATVDLLAGAAASVLIEFTGPGTLTAAAALPLAAIAGFGGGDTILLPVAGVTSTLYAATGAGTGVLTLFGQAGALGTLTLLGIGAETAFTAAPAGTGAGGSSGTILTTQPTTNGGGVSNMGTQVATSGSGTFGVVSDFAWWAALPAAVQDPMAAFQAASGNESWIWTSPDGTDFGAEQPFVANIAIAQNPVINTKVVLPPGYNALLAQGGNAVVLTDAGQGHALIYGNAGNDTIVGFGDGDTLVGGTGNNVIWCSDSGSIGTIVDGGGNDTIITSLADATINTSTGNQSVLFLGAASNSATLNGTDTVVCGSGVGANDTITATGSAIAFSPTSGELNFMDGAGRDIVVGEGGTLRVIGGSGNNGVLWCGNASYVRYIGGAGTEQVVGGSGLLSVQGGEGLMTVFGGSGEAQIQGGPGRDRIVLGSGASTVTAASGNLVWSASAANDSLVASGGNIIIWAADATGNNVFQAGSGPCTLHGGSGADTFLGGAGAATLSGGGGADIYSFTNGLAGGAVEITDFNTATDQIDLHGYGTYSASLVGGVEVVSLSDGTRIQLDGLTSLAGVSISAG